MALDDGLDNVELKVVPGYWFRDSTILEEPVLHLHNLMDEKSYITPIIKNQVRSVTLTIILRLYQVIQDVVSVLLDTLTLPGKHRSRFIILHDSQSVILGRENVERSPTEVTAEGIESLNQD